jgi:DNA-binding NarL/FixJ family response regulator
VTLLLVEDEAPAREALLRALERENIDAVGAESVEDALAKLEGIRFLEGVVADVRLGADELGGMRLLSELKLRNVRAPVVIITAFADVEIVKRALNDGAAYLMEKPFRAADLIATLRRVLAEPRDIGFLVERALAQANLTDKELSIAKLVLKGLTSVEIARLEGNAEKTVRQHITRVYLKCGVSTRAELFHFVFPW